MKSYFLTVNQFIRKKTLSIKFALFIAMVTCFIFCAFINSSEINRMEYELIVFEGSDWCQNCRKLEKNVISDTLFGRFLTQNNIKLIRIDFPQRKILSKVQMQSNQVLAEKFQFNGVFPTIILSRTDTFSYNKLNFKNSSAIDIMNEIKFQMKKLE